MHRNLNFLALFFVVVATYLCIVAFLTSNDEKSTARLGLTVDRAYSSSTNLFIMALVVWIGSWYNYTILPTIKD